jgi:hypothetical protein
MLLQGQAVTVFDLAIDLKSFALTSQLAKMFMSANSMYQQCSLRGKWLTDDLVRLLNKLRLYRFVLPLRSSRQKKLASRMAKCSSREN